MKSAPIKYPCEVASEFFTREEQNPLTFEHYLTGRATHDSDHRDDYPTKVILIQLVETMLFASMATEEGHLTQVGIVFAQDEKPFQHKRTWNLTRFASTLGFDVSQLAKLASACGSSDSLLAVVPTEGKLEIVGIATPHSQWIEPDLLVRVVILKPGVISVRRGEQELVRYERGSIPPQPPSLEKCNGQSRPQLDSIEREIFQADPMHLRIDVLDFLKPIIESMIRLGHGGLLAILGPDHDPTSSFDT
jgi:hypothetical protein